MEISNSFDTHTVADYIITVTMVTMVIILAEMMMIERMIRQLVQFLPALRGWLGPARGTKNTKSTRVPGSSQPEGPGH